MAQLVEQSPSEAPVVIVGCGIAGAVLAKSLTKAGVQCTIIEKEIEVPERFRGEILQAYGVAMLNMLGIAEPIYQENSSIVRKFQFIARDEHGLQESIFDTDESDDYFGHCLTCRHQDLYMKVRKLIREDPDVTFLEGWQFDNLRKTDDGQWMVETHSLNENAGSIKTPVVVGADGAKSRLHRLLPFETVSMPPETFLIGAIFESPDFQNDTFLFLSEEDWLLYIFPVGDSCARIAFQARHTTIREYRKKSEAELTALLTEITGRYGIKMRNSRIVESVQIMPIYRIRNQFSAIDRVHLIGDALGTVNPITGHGMTIACHDALQLSTYLRQEVFAQGANGRGTTVANRHKLRAEGYRRLIEQYSDNMVSGFLGNSESSPLQREALMYSVGLPLEPARIKENPFVTEVVDLDAAIGASVSDSLAQLCM